MAAKLARSCVYVLILLFFRLQTYQSFLDRLTPHTKFRWVAAVVLILVFLLRIFIYQGWYIVTYALGIYHLNLFIAFLTPKIDPALDFDGELEFLCGRVICALSEEG